MGYFLNFLFAGIVLLAGCATKEAPLKQFREDAATSLASKDWDAAYRNLEDALVSNDIDLRKSALDVISQESSVRIAAVNSFTISALKKSLKDWGIESGYAREKIRLEYFSIFATTSEQQTARDNLEKARREIVIDLNKTDYTSAELIVTDIVFNEFSLLSREELKNKYKTLLVLDWKSVGKIGASQVVNLSTSGTNSAARLGSAIGQAAFIDNTVGRGGYSVMGQLTAGVLAAAIGSEFDEKPTSQFLIRYSIKMNDGSIVGLDRNSSNGMPKPVGQCVFLSNVNPAPHYLCEDSLSSFLIRVKQLNQTGVVEGVDVDVVRIKCKIDSVGIVEIEKNSCVKSGGIAVE